MHGKGRRDINRCRMCKKLRAENYVWLISADSLDCMANLWPDLPMFKDVYAYCESGAAMIAVAIATALAFL